MVTIAEHPDEELLPSVIAPSDVMPTGWFAATCANVQPGMHLAFTEGGTEWDEHLTDDEYPGDDNLGAP